MQSFRLLPVEVVHKIMLYMISPTAEIFKRSKYYRTRYPFRKLLEVSKFPRKCQRSIRREYYKMYLDAFIESLGRAREEIDLKNPVFALPTEEDFERQEEQG